MAINRLAVSNPGATTDTLLHTATRNALVSVIATNTTTASVKTRIWVVPTGQDATPANWAYLSYDSDITGTNSLETFRFPIETGDKVYVRSNVSGISYSLNAVYEVVGNSYIFAQTGEPNAPTVGDIWVDTDNVANELNTNDYLLKADASAPSGYLLKTDAASTYVELAGDTMTGNLTVPGVTVNGTTVSNGLISQTNSVNGNNVIIRRASGQTARTIVVQESDASDVAGLNADGQFYHGASTGRVLPYATSAGIISISGTSVASGGQVNVSVTFPANRFTQPPVVSTTLQNGPGGSAGIVPRAIGVSASGFSLYTYNLASTTQTWTGASVGIHAVQLTSSAYSIGTLQ